MKTKDYLCRILAIMLTAVMVVSSYPQAAIVAYATPGVTDEAAPDVEAVKEVDDVDDAGEDTKPAKAEETGDEAEAVKEDITDSDLDKSEEKLDESKTDKPKEENIESDIDDDKEDTDLDIKEVDESELIENEKIVGGEKDDKKPAVSDKDKKDIIEEKEEASEELIEEEADEEENSLEASGKLSISDDSPSVDNLSTEGWSWDLEAKTLTLDGANFTNGVIIFCDATINVVGESTISSPNSKALTFSGSKAENLRITGTATLHLETSYAYATALAANNDGYEHNIIVSGSDTSVECINNAGNNAIYVVGGSLTVEDGAILTASVDKNASPISCSANSSIMIRNGGTINASKPGATPAIWLEDNARVDVLSKGKFNIENGEGDAIYIYGSNGVVNISGIGSVVNVNHTDHSRPSSSAIAAAGEATVSITDGGKLVSNNVYPHSSGLIFLSKGDVDIRGGIVAAHTLPDKSFEGKNLILGLTIQYDENALMDSVFNEGAYYDSIYISKSIKDFFYGNLLNFVTVPKKAYGVKTGNTATLAVSTEIVNTLETPTVSYQWYKDGVKVVGATDESYTTPVLADGVYEYKCEASAEFTDGTVTISTQNSKVYVNPSGKATVDTVITIDETTESVDNLAEEGWAWDKDEKKLSLSDAALDRIVISGVAATIDNVGDSIISSENGVPLFYEGSGASINITGEGTLTFENRKSDSHYQRVIEGKDSSVGPLVISGASLTVNCNSANGLHSAIDVYDKLEITNGAELNISSPKGSGIHVYENSQLLVNGGSRLVIYSDHYKSIQLQDHVAAAFTGEGTEVVFNATAERTGRAIFSSGDKFEVSDHARLVINNCRTDAYEELDFSVSEINIVGGVLEFNAPSGGRFPDNKSIIRSGKDKLIYNAEGIENGYFGSYSGQDHLFVKTETNKWIYTGDKAYINITKQPVNKYIVNGNTATLDLEAEVIFGAVGQIITYQWYKNSVAIVGATDASYTTDVLSDESNEYYCIASATVKGIDLNVKSEVVTVEANFSGKATRTENLNLSDPGTESEVNELEGWSWDKENKILTLENYTQRMTDGIYGITIPAGTTIVLKGTNRIDMESYNSAIYTRGGSGKVIICGDGTLDITCPTDYGISTSNGLEVLGSIEIGDMVVYSKLTGAAALKPVHNTSTGLYEARIVTDNEPRLLFSGPEDKVYTSSVGGTAPKITVGAKLMGATGAVTYQYQWYATDEWNNPEEHAVPVSKGATLTAPVKDRGGKYYYCEVTATYNKKQYKKTSDVYAVVVGSNGLLPLTEKTVLGSASVDHMTDQGWSYDASTCTLTFKNLEAFIPFASNSSDYYLFVINGNPGIGINVVLSDGSVNHISECCHGIYCSYGNALEISGNGILNYESGPKGCLGLLYLTYSFADLTISGGSKLNVYGGYNVLLNPAINITVDNAEATFDQLFNYSYGSRSNVHVGEGGVLSLTGPGEKEAKNVTVDRGGALYLLGSGAGLVIDRNDGVGELNVSGLLSIASDSYALTIHGADPETRIHISDSVILVPEGKTISELLVTSSGDRHYYCNGNLLIAPSDFSRTVITGISDITGDTAIGSTLTAGNVLPVGATANYIWQHAISKDVPDELWSDTGITGDTFMVDDIYAGEYIRVKATGNGKYSGTVYSKPTLAISTTDVSLADFVVEDMHYGRLSTTYTNYPPSTYYPASITGEVYVRALPDNEDALVTIKNITPGFTSKTEEEKTINGTEGILPIYIDAGKSTTNDFEITVSMGSSVAVYRTYIDYRISTRQITLAADDHCTLVLTDSSDVEVLRVDHSAKLRWIDLPAGEEYTLTAISELDGWYVSAINSTGIEDNGELIAGKRVLKFTVPNDKGLTFNVKDSELRCIAPSVNAYWSLSSPGYCIKVDWDEPLPTIDYDSRYTGRISAEMFDEDGNEIRLKAASIDNPQGFSYYSELLASGIITERDEADNEVSFDTTKNYTLRFWYDAGEKQVCDVLEVPVSATDLSMNKHHIVIEKPALGETANTTVDVRGRAFRAMTFPETGAVIVDPAIEGGYVTVTVTDAVEIGTVYALMYVRKPDGKIVSEPLSIDIIEPSAEITAGLSTTGGTMNIYSNDRLIVPVNIIGSAKPVVSARFVDSNNTTISDKYVINVFGDREMEIVPVGTSDTDKTDWAKVAKSYTGSFKAKIEVTLEGDNAYVTKDTFTLTVKATAPKVTATAIKLNSFYMSDRADVILKANGAILEAKIDEVKTTAKTPACPSWISLEDGGQSVVLDNSNLSNNKGSGKMYLKVWVDGYRMPAQISVPVSAAYGAPKLKLNMSTLTLPLNHSKYNGFAKIAILSNDKKISFEDLNITNVKVATPTDLSELSAKDRESYAASKYYRVNAYNPENGEIELDAYTSSVSVLPLMPAGKILLYAEVGGNKNQRISLPLTIKTENDDKVTIKMSQKTITLNSNKAIGTELIKVNLVPSSTSYDCSAAVVTVTDTRGNGDYSDKLEIARNKYEYTISTNALTSDGTYRVNISVPGVAKPATLDVVVKPSIPTLKSDKKTVNVDVFGDYKESKKQTMTLTLSDNTIKRNFSHFSYRVFDSAKKPADGELYVSFSGYENDPIVASIGANAYSKLGKYTVELVYTMPGSGVESVEKVNVNVGGKLPTIKPSKTAVTLNSSLGKSDMATVEFDRPDDYYYAGYDVTVLDKKNKPIVNAVICDYSDGILTMYPGIDAEPGDTYKVKIRIGVIGLSLNDSVANTINVKMAAINKSTGKSAITQKVATKGKLELARSESSLKVIPSYNGWNGATAMGAAMIPEVTWTIYAYKGSTPYQYGDVSYQYAGDDGKVACSTPSGSLDWFSDVEPSEEILLKLNPSSLFVREVSELTGLSFKLVLNTTYNDYYGAGEDLVLSTTTSFKVNGGTVKLSAPNPDKVTLNRCDKYDSKIVKVNLTDADALSLNIREVKMKDGSSFDATLLYVGGDYAYVAIGWKDDTTPVNIKQGKQTLEFYSGYNYIGREKCSGSTMVTVNVQ